MQYCTTVLVALASLSACVTEPDTSVEVSAGTVKGGGGNGDPCPSTGCGTNSPHLGPSEFHELESSGSFANREGFRVTGMIKDNHNYVPQVTGMLLVGKLGGVTVLQDQDLVGAELLITNDKTGEDFRIRIMRVSHAQTFWQGPPSSLETYELWWRRDVMGAGTYARVCNDPPDRRDPDGTFWNVTAEAILFTGDRYDRETLRVIPPGRERSSTWFNIGCSGNVLSKLVLNRHTTASQLPASPTTIAQRQAMLKMYTSDVCGMGYAFTKQGTPLYWSSSMGWSNAAPAYPNLEARWDENGAICLDTHRLHGSADEMDSQIHALCPGLHACAPSMPAGYLTTTSPAH